MSKKVTDLPAGDADGAVFYAVNGSTDNKVTGGTANGVATYDAGGKIPSDRLPNLGILYKGLWDASTNTPTLADGTGAAGAFYLVDVAGSQDLGSGSIDFLKDDRVIYNGTVWEKGTPKEGVHTVNGKSGPDVVLDAADVGAATTAQGAEADTAVQPGDLATVATTGSYNDLVDVPSSFPIDTNQSYDWTQPQTFSAEGGGSSAGVQAVGFAWHYRQGDTDAKWWDAVAGLNKLELRLVSDDNTNSTGWGVITRNGMTVTKIEWLAEVDMGGNKIVDLLDGTDPQDGVTKAQLDTKADASSMPDFGTAHFGTGYMGVDTSGGTYPTIPSGTGVYLMGGNNHNDLLFVDMNQTAGNQYASLSFDHGGFAFMFRDSESGVGTNVMSMPGGYAAGVGTIMINTDLDLQSNKITKVAAVLAADGSVDAPSYSFASDPETGFRYQNSNVGDPRISVCISGMEVAYFNTNSFIMGAGIKFDSLAEIESATGFATDASGYFSIANRLHIDAPADGAFHFKNVHAANSGNQLRTEGNVVKVKNDDNSAFAPIQGKLRTDTAAAAETPTATHTLIIEDSNGDQYKVLAVAV